MRVTATTVALVFGWMCGSVTAQTTDSFWISFLVAFVSGVVFGVGEALWRRRTS